MSKTANPTIIGGFVIGAVFLFLAGMVVFAKGTFWIKKPVWVLYFEGPVSGLSVGAPVNFKGVKIGSVSNVLVRVNLEDKSIRTPVYIEIDRDRILEVNGISESQEELKFVQKMIQRGLRAQLSLQSLITGQLAIEFNFYPGTPIKIVGADPNYPEFPTIPSRIELFTERFEKLPLDELIKSVLSMVQSFEKTMGSPELAKVVTNLDRTLISVQGLIKNIDEEIKPISSSIQDTSKEARFAIEDIKEFILLTQIELDKTLKSLQALSQNVNQRVGPLALNIKLTAVSTRKAMEEARKMLSIVEDFVEEESPLKYEIFSTLEKLSAAARSIRVLAEYLERNPNALIYGKRSTENN